MVALQVIANCIGRAKMFI